MRINSKSEYIWSDRQNRYILLSQKSIFWTGPVALCKGATDQQKEEAAASQKFTESLQNDYAQQFANQNAILGSLRSSLSPIIAAGPNQYGFSPEQEQVLNSQAIQGTGQQYANAKKALNEDIAAAGGGNEFLPSGVAAQQRAQLASTGANQASSQLLGIKQAGYQQGYNMYQNALDRLSGVAQIYNPTGFAGQATGAGANAFNQASEVQKADAAASPWNVVGGILGGAAGAFAGGLGGGVGKAIGSTFGGTTAKA